MSYGTIRSKFSIKIYVSNIEEHFLIVIFGTSIVTKNITVIKKKNNLLLSLKHIKSQMLYGTEKRHNNSKLNFLVVFLWIYKCYIQEKIMWIEANYKHYFRMEITLFTMTFFLVTAKKCKLTECHTGHVVRGTLSKLEIHWFYCTKLM